MPRYIPERTRRRVAYQRERRFERVQTGYKRWVDPFPKVLRPRVGFRKPLPAFITMPPGLS